VPGRAVLQFVPALKIGYLYTYWGPLLFVLAVTIAKEAFDDLQRYRRDREGASTHIMSPVDWLSSYAPC
jgi:phospholipid-translocating ATPase